jgi:pimeloyl-ACP methyl ester carboxylesterase
MKEEALLFGNRRSLLGIVTDPPTELRGHHLPGVILLNAGIVHRVGPNRLYVKLARRLAAMGVVVLRFDFSGIGDSNSREDGLPFHKSSVRETQEAMDALHAARGTQSFILLGICSGAGVALQAAWSDSRIRGLVLINNRDFYKNDLASYTKNHKMTREYWKVSLYNPQKWARALTGKANYRNILKAIGFQFRGTFRSQSNLSLETTRIAADAQLLAERRVRLFLLYSEHAENLEHLNVTMDDQAHWKNFNGNLTIEIIPQADHLFNSLSSQAQLFQAIHDWIHPMVMSTFTSEE